MRCFGTARLGHVQDLVSPVHFPDWGQMAAGLSDSQRADDMLKVRCLLQHAMQEPSKFLRDNPPVAPRGLLQIW